MRVFVAICLALAAVAALAVGVWGVTGWAWDLRLVPAVGVVESVSSRTEPIWIRADHPDAASEQVVVTVAYRWQVGEATYRGDRFMWDERHEAITDPDEARLRVRGLQPGTRVGLWVDPRDPSQAVMARRILAPPLLVSGMGLGLLLAAGLTLLWRPLFGFGGQDDR